MQALGVTRVARITGLDRTGVEVACAIRPLGHVLQVCNGKGETWEEARRGALSEAAELACAEAAPSPLEVVWASRAELEPRLGRARVWGVGELGSAGRLLFPALAGPSVRMAWLWAQALGERAPVCVPAQAVHCLPPGSASLGPQAVGWSTNGMGAHPSRAKAVEHALLEAVERDQLARALPEGWTRAHVRRRRYTPGATEPRTSALVARLERQGFRVHLFELSPSRDEGGVGLPVRCALLVDPEGGPVPLAAGYACRLEPDAAARAAVLEAAQSRLTDIHGAREDVGAGEKDDVAPLLEWLREPAAGRVGRSRPRAASRRSGRGRATPVQAVCAALERAGHARVAVVPLTEAAPRGLHVVKVVVPGLRVSGLL